MENAQIAMFAKVVTVDDRCWFTQADAMSLTLHNVSQPSRLRYGASFLSHYATYVAWDFALGTHVLT